MRTDAVTDHTFQPWRGSKPVWQGGTRTPPSDAYMDLPYRWARRAAKQSERQRVFVASRADVLEVVEQPAAWPSGWQSERIAKARRHVACARDTVEAQRFRLWGIIRGTHRHLDWLLLTKRPERWRLIPEDVRRMIWIGTSVSDQATADVWVPRLLEAPGFRMRFVVRWNGEILCVQMP